MRDRLGFRDQYHRGMEESGRHGATTDLQSFLDSLDRGARFVGLINEVGAESNQVILLSFWPLINFACYCQKGEQPRYLHRS